MTINTWLNKAGNPMAIADSAEAACSMWQADPLEGLEGVVPQYATTHTLQIIDDARRYAMDSNAPGIEDVLAAGDAGHLFEYCP